MSMTAWLPVKPDMKGFGPDLHRGVQSAGESAGGKFSSGFKSKLKLGAGIAVALGGAAALNFMKGAVKQASDLGESINAVNVTFGKNAEEIHKLGKAAAESVGLSRSQFNGLAVQFSAFASTIAGKGGDVTGVMKDLTTRGADFASVMNLEVNDAMELFQSGLAGETEPLRKFGIDLSAAAVEAHAYEKGIASAGKELTENEKVQARYSLLMEKTSKTQGDFANTSDSLANSQRILGAKWDDLQAKIGSKLLPVLADLTSWVADKGLPALERWWGVLDQKLGPVFDKVGGFIKNILVPTIKDLVGRFTGAKDGTDKLGGAMKDAEPYINVLKGAFKALGVIFKEVVLPVLRWAADNVLPALGKAFGAIGTAVTFLWNKVLAPTFRFILKGLSTLLSYWATMLKALGKVPGFGWAKDAAEKLRGAADKANALARGIDNIDRDVDVKVKYRVEVTGKEALDSLLLGPMKLEGGKAMGGPVRAGRAYLVGEHGPEIFRPNVAGGIVPNARLGSTSSGLIGAEFGGGRSGVTIGEGAVQVTMPATATPEAASAAAGGRVLDALAAIGG
jgi:hypothetical protein